MKHLSNSVIKAVIFDCDGTLIESEGSHFYAWQKVILERGYFLSLEEYMFCLGNANPTIAKMLADKMGASTEELLAERIPYFHEHAKKGHLPIRHTVDFVFKLAKEKEMRGIRLAVASAGKKSEILQSLKLLGIEHLFDAIVSGQDDLHTYHDPQGVNKPSPYIYQHTAKLLGVEPSACVVIEDSLNGMKSAMSAGCFTVVIPTSTTQFQDLSAAHLKLNSFENMSVKSFFNLIHKAVRAYLDIPTVIFLNGTSSSGKTSLVHPLQEKLEKPFLHVGIDHFLSMLPSRYILSGSEDHLGYHLKRNDDRDGPKATVTKGVYANMIHKTKFLSIRSLLQQGFNLIIDEVMFAEDDFDEYLTTLKNANVYFIAVKPPREVAEQREKLRGDRILGLARGLYETAYDNKIFDLQIDSSQYTAEEAAQKIIEYMQEKTPHAFNQYIHAYDKTLVAPRQSFPQNL